jgi:hypothetical protein
MLPDGMIKTRKVNREIATSALDCVAVVGDEIKLYFPHAKSSFDEADLRTRQSFGDGTTALVKSLRVGVAGCSGTGSWVIEMLARLGVGHLALIDPDLVEGKNLNRIVNTTKEDVSNRRFKADVMVRAINNLGRGTKVEVICKDLSKREVIEALGSCDIIFGCLDSADGRDLLNRISTYYTVPYFDVGVRLDADGIGGVHQICCAIHYLIPGGSSLLSRGVITTEQVSAQSLRRHDAYQYAARLKEGYIHGIQVESPAVISVNGFASSHAINEFLARLHPFRSDPNSEYRYQLFSLKDGNWLRLSDGPDCEILQKKIGRGDTAPLLDNPFSE